MNGTRQKTQSIDSRIRARIHGYGRGSVFVPGNFLDLGSREAVDLALHRFARKGTIRRLARGVYDFPKKHPVLGLLAPSADTVARALAGRDRTRLQPAGAYAANILGLSEQVPAKAIFLTDGASRTVKIGPTTIELRRTTPRNMAAAGRLSGLLWIRWHFADTLQRNLMWEKDSTQGNIRCCTLPLPGGAMGVEIKFGERGRSRRFDVSFWRSVEKPECPKTVTVFLNDTIGDSDEMNRLFAAMEGG